MTITLNKSLSQIIIRIVWDIVPDSSKTQILSIFKDFTSETYKLELENNLSPVKYRFGEYNLDNSKFKDIAEGLYTYIVYNQNEEDIILTEGSLKIVSDVKEEVVEYKSDNNYISYGE